MNVKFHKRARNLAQLAPTASSAERNNACGEDVRPALCRQTSMKQEPNVVWPCPDLHKFRRTETLKIILPEFIQKLSSKACYNFREVFLIWWRSISKEDRDTYIKLATKHEKKASKKREHFDCLECGSKVRGTKMGALWCPTCKKPVVYHFEDFS